jgi:hypothetical protein
MVGGIPDYGEWSFLPAPIATRSLAVATWRRHRSGQEAADLVYKKLRRVGKRKLMTISKELAVMALSSTSPIVPFRLIVRYILAERVGQSNEATFHERIP